MPSNQPERLSLIVAADRQDVTWLEHASFRGQKVRIEIRSNAYKSQCHAWLDVLEPAPMQWNRICWLPAASMITEEGLAYLPGATSRKPAEWGSRFAEDRAALLDLFSDLAP